MELNEDPAVFIIDTNDGYINHWQKSGRMPWTADKLSISGLNGDEVA